MKRSEAQSTVDQVTFKTNQYRCVCKGDAKFLLGDDSYGKLLSDPIRCLGVDGTIYPWNVVDYLVEARK